MIVEKVTSCFFYEELSHMHMLCFTEGHEFVIFMREILLKKKNVVLVDSSCDVQYVKFDINSFSYEVFNFI